jgi:hypothetical protein
VRQPLRLTPWSDNRGGTGVPLQSRELLQGELRAPEPEPMHPKL